MDNLKEALKNFFNFKPTKRGVRPTPWADYELPVVTEDTHDDETWLVVGMGDCDG